MSMKAVVLYLILIVIGLVVLAWPEENNLMMVKLSETHGPSTLDLVGIGIIFLGYIPLIIPVFTRFSVIQQAVGKQLSLSMVVAVVFFSVMIAIGLGIENDVLIWVSVAISTMLQAILVYLSYRKITVQ
jgi:hypothetical protein